MKIASLPAIECAVLHDSFKPLNGNDLLAFVKQVAVEILGIPECQPMVTCTEKDIHVMAGEYRIMVSQNNEPLGMDGFRSALTTPYTGMVLPDAQNLVQRHKANTFVTIGKGAIDTALMPAELQQLVGDMGSFTQSDEADRAMRAVQALTKIVVGHNPASAIHWCPSDNLIPQKFFEMAVQSEDQSMLYLRPYLTSSAGQMGEGFPVGMAVNGSQWLLGKMVTFDEAKVPVDWMIQTVFAFIKICQMRGSIIQHNNTFGTEGEDWTIAVYHEKIEGHDAWEQVRLKLINAPEFGIYGDTFAKVTHHYKDEADIKARAEAEQHETYAANDTSANEAFYMDEMSDADRAIAELVRKRELENSASPEPETIEEIVAKPSTVQHEAWTGSKGSAIGIKRLRELAKQGRELEEKRRAQGPGNRLFSKAKGLLSKKK